MKIYKNNRIVIYPYGKFFHGYILNNRKELKNYLFIRNFFYVIFFIIFCLFFNRIALRKEDLTINNSVILFATLSYLFTCFLSFKNSKLTNSKILYRKSFYKLSIFKIIMNFLGFVMSVFLAIVFTFDFLNKGLKGHWFILCFSIYTLLAYSKMLIVWLKYYKK